MPATLKTNPMALGKLLPGATFATASVAVTANFTGASALDFTTCEVIDIQANTANTGVIYVCSTSANPDKTNFLNVLKILSAGQSYTMLARATGLNTLRLDSVFIGADNAVDFAIANVRVA